MSFTFPAVIYIGDAETTVEVEASYYQSDPDVGYMTPWIELDSVTDGNGDDIKRNLNEEQKAQLLEAAADECECIKEDRMIERFL